MGLKEAAQNVINVAKDYLSNGEFWPETSDEDITVCDSNREILDNPDLDQLLYRLKVAICSDSSAEQLLSELNKFEETRDVLNKQSQPNSQTIFFEELKSFEEDLEFLDAVLSEREKLDAVQDFNLYFFTLPNRLRAAYVAILEEHQKNLASLQKALIDFPVDFIKLKIDSTHLMKLIQNKHETYATSVAIMKTYEFESSEKVEAALQNFDTAMGYQPEDIASLLCKAYSNNNSDDCVVADLEKLRLSNSSAVVARHSNSIWHQGDQNVTKRRQASNSRVKGLSPMSPFF